jgi:hypothetical protein
VAGLYRTITQIVRARRTPRVARADEATQRFVGSSLAMPSRWAVAVHTAFELPVGNANRARADETAEPRPCCASDAYHPTRSSSRHMSSRGLAGDRACDIRNCQEASSNSRHSAIKVISGTRLPGRYPRDIVGHPKCRVRRSQSHVYTMKQVTSERRTQCRRQRRM